MEYKMIKDWLISESLNQGISVVLEQEMRNSNINDLYQLAEVNFNLISAKLDALINAPYKKAIMRLKEKDFIGAKDCVETAISNDSLNIPARLLHYQLLIRENKLDIACDYAKEAIEMFGNHFNIFPKVLFDCIYNINNHIIPKGKIEFQDYNKANDVLICNRGVIAVKDMSFFLRLFGKKSYSAIVSDWNGRRYELICKNSNEISIIHATSHFFILELSHSYNVYRWSDFNLVNTLSYSTYKSIFGTYDNPSKSYYKTIGSRLKSDDETTINGVILKNTEINYITTSIEPETSEVGLSAWVEEEHENTDYYLTIIN